MSPRTQTCQNQDVPPPAIPGAACGTIRPMAPGDAPACVELIRRAMDPGEAEYAHSTFRFHFESRERGMDDGRRIYVCETGGSLVGIVGLHFYVWGPRENVWLSWFAVDPAHQGSGLGRRMFEAAMEEAARLGYGKILIETYANATFAKATRFYLSQGFCVAGTIAGYMPDGSSMVVLSRSVAPTVRVKTQDAVIEGYPPSCKT